MTNDIEILMAVYNQERFVDEQLESIFAQNYSKFHLIVRDNCSTDRTKEILKAWSQKYPDKMTVIFGEKNLGVLGNFSTLIELAKAPYIMFSDADDVWLPHKIKNTRDAMQKMEQMHGKSTPILVHSDLTVTDGALKVRHSSFWKTTKLDGSRPLEFKRALVENQVTGCTLMMNQALLKLAHPIPQQAAMHDAWIALVAAAFGETAAISESMILYRQHGNNDFGATQYGLLSYLKKLIDPKKRQKIIDTRRKRISQAEIFLEKYGDNLSPAKREDVAAYLEANRSSAPVRVFLLWKNNYLETGLFRKLFQILIPL